MFFLKQLLASFLISLFALPALSRPPLCHEVYLFTRTHQGVAMGDINYIPLSSNFNFGKINDKPISYPELLRLQSTVQKVQHIATHLVFPNNLKIFVSKVTQTPTTQMTRPYSIVTGTSIAFENPQLKKLFKLRPYDAETIFAHELGHVIFAHNLYLQYPFVRSAEFYAQKLTKMMQIQQSVEALALKVKNSKDPEFHLQAHQKLEDSLSQFAKHETNYFVKGRGRTQQTEHTMDTIGFYSEFFADVVAVLLKERPDAIYKTFNIPGQPYEAAARRRHFLNTETALARKSLQHSYFSIARTHIWTHYLSNSKFLKQRKADILLATFKATAKGVEATSLERAQIEWTSPQIWKELNLELIKSLDAHLSPLQK